MYSKNDIRQFRRRGLKPEQVDEQIENLKRGFAPVAAAEAATVGNGVTKLTEDEAQAAVRAFESRRGELDMVKFVPASGSATRMFKLLNSFRARYTGSDEDYLEYLRHKEPGTVFSVFQHLKAYPFYARLKERVMEDRKDLDKMLWKNQFEDILDYLLTERGLDYNHTPKALIDFHVYPGHTRTALEEHLVEAALYCSDGRRAKTHFTVSEEHMRRVKELVKRELKFYKKDFGVAFDVTYSAQKPETDMVSLDRRGELLRDGEGNVVFRPGGHGALIHNLNELKERVIFIKNIDNVLPDRNKEATVFWKKALAGVLLETQERLFGYMRRLERGKERGGELLAEAEAFLRERLGFRPAEGSVPADPEERARFLARAMDRPLRVCGMVRNEGEPGGGPFWVSVPGEGERLMIVESAQLNLRDKEQKRIFASSTHFNPVDIVCSPYNYRGKKYDLEDFIDRGQGFVTEKSYNGEDIRAQELPGLWNGAMAGWNTLFVEVPLATFSPVKTVFDLLRFEHRNMLRND